VSRLYLVRHGQAAGSWDGDLDPGLSDAGRSQAEALTETLPGPLPLVVSPLRRTRETALPLERHFGISARVEPRVGEIATPDGIGLADRGSWLRELMGLRWPELSNGLQAWRQGVLDALSELRRDTVVVTHYIAINVALGAVTGDDRVVHTAPENASVTVIDGLST
jgi:broad specificity phosphatase PhoE